MPTKTTRLHSLERQIARLATAEARLTRLSDRFSNLRLWLVVLGLPAIWGTFVALRVWAGLALLGGLVVIFGIVVTIHERIRRSLADHAGYRALKAEHIARIRLDWNALPPAPHNNAPPDHPFALDLDLIGPRSLHRLLDTTTTEAGSQRLLDWLLTRTPDPGTISARQVALQELIPLVRLRDRLQLVSRREEHGPSARWSGAHLQQWLAAHPPAADLRRLVFTLAGLSTATVALLVLDRVAGFPPIWIGTLLLYIGLSVLRRDRVGDLFGEALMLADSLRRITPVFAFLEGYPLPNQPHLKALLQPIRQADRQPSAYLRRASRVAAAASLQTNPFLWLPINLIVPWDVFFAWRLARQRARLAALLPAWLAAWAELEALCALATFAYLNPDYTFPALDTRAEQAYFDAQEAGHPLIPFTEKVCNDFAIRRGEIVLITGSNMSGKSSFLRTVGVNMVLAYAGSVVNAESLTLTPFRLFSSIRVTDSVVDGISYFYAEVRRLRALLEAIENDETPLFFLIDEIFRGTNNRERLLGSRAYIRALAQRSATGLIATHDLELVQLEEAIPSLRNHHFRETVADGRMHFDYRLRPGPSPTTNALIIMAMEGLPVEDTAP